MTQSTDRTSVNLADLKLVRVRQTFPRGPALNVAKRVEAELAKLVLEGSLRPGMRVAVAVGSRGISRLAEIVQAAVRSLKAHRVAPFIVPAMGSHGGATAAGQLAVLAEYGVTEASMSVPIDSSIEAECLGQDLAGTGAWFSTAAFRADAILPINRIKPHTDFSGGLGSGLLKMLVVGLGKPRGALEFHAAALRRGHEAVLRSLGQVLLPRVKLLGGLALLEGFHHELARIEAVSPANLEAAEARLVAEARAMLARLPFDDIDLLIVDRLGKDVSGTGMDPNVIGRGVQGYLSFGEPLFEETPRIGRIYVRDLTSHTRGNAIGIGMADFCSTRVVKALDPQVTSANVLTALSIQAAKIPIAFETDREAIEQALRSLALPCLATAKVVRIRDTLSLAEFAASEPCLRSETLRGSLERLGVAVPPEFDAEGNLVALDWAG